MNQRLDSFTLRDLFKRRWIPSLVSAAVLLFLAYVLEHAANAYVFSYSLRPTSLPVGDILLDNIPVVDLNFIIIEVALIAVVVGALFILSRPRYVLFTLKTFAIFVVARAVAISLTHVGIHPDHVVIPGLGLFDSVYLYLNLQTGLFFSGHTGLPILMACIFWRERPARAIFLSLAAVFAVAVLLAHVHDSIDVFAAPFMAYGVYKFSEFLFPHDYALIEEASA